MMHNYTVADAVGTLAAVMTFALVFLPPGFMLGWASNVLGFRSRSPGEKLLLSLVLSMATTPIFAALVGRKAGLAVCLAVFCVLSLAAITLLWKELAWSTGFFGRVPRTTWIGLGIMALWLVVAIVSVIDLQFGDRLYPSAAIFDHSVRIPFVESAARTGVPPVNPFFGLGKAPILRYYYYWYVVCALPERLVGLPGRACFDASVVWSGFGLAAIIPLFLKHFFRETDALRRKSLIGISLLLVTGLDLIPYSLICFGRHRFFADLEWWDPNQVTSWLDSLVWVPHHVAALTACMAGLLILSALDENAGMRERGWAAAISGLAFASAAGLSVFVTFTFAVFAVLWTIILLAQRHVRDSVTYAAAGGLALVLSLPYLSDLRTVSSIGQQFAVFAIRDFPDAMEWLEGLGLHGFTLDFAKLPILILLYVLELGFFLWVGVFRFKRELLGGEALTQQRRAAWVMLASCLLVVSALRSDPAATDNNDLGFRGILPVQFVLLLWAAPLVHDLFAGRGSAPVLRPMWKGLLVCSLVLGVLGTVCQLGILRCYAPLVDSGRLERSEDYFGLSPALGRRIYALRDGLEGIGKATKPTSVLQYNPASINAWLIHLYSTRQAAAGDENCASLFGGDPEKCQQAMPYLMAAFNSPASIPGWDLDRLCDRFSVNVMVATEVDPVWHDTISWVWSRDPLVANKSVRAIACGTESATQATLP